jgi:ketosteroid isomerase-like protein
MVARLATVLLFLSAAGLARVAAQESPPVRDQPDFTKALITTEPTAGSAPAPDSTTAIENAVLATHDAVVAAIEAREFGRLATLLISTDRGALVADGRITLRNDDMIETLRREFAPLSSVHHTFTRRHISLLSPTTALIVTEGTIAARADDGATVARPFAQTLVFMKVDDTWKLAHLHSSTPPATLGDR